MACRSFEIIGGSWVRCFSRFWLSACLIQARPARKRVSRAPLDTPTTLSA